MKNSARRINFTGFISLLVVCALLLLARVVYVYVSEPGRFPVNTVKISANFEHISRGDIEEVLDRYNNSSFIMLPISRLQADLSALNWAKNIKINRIWPDTLKITITEKTPIAMWRKSFITDDGNIISSNNQTVQRSGLEHSLPKLNGPEDQQQEVLQNYQKLSKLLSSYGLHADSLHLHNNQSWDLYLADGAVLRLGKRDIEKRVLRFCKAYSAVFADKSEKLASVDLRYPHGMAVQWNASNK